MSTNPTIAVIMATRNGERWLADQLASIARQSRPPDRLVISDDGSTDATRSIAQDFATQAPFPVEVVAGPGTGLADNFWSAAARADSDLVAWADQDDVWHPDKLARCERALVEHDAVFVSHAAEVVDASMRPVGSRYPAYTRDAVLGPLEGDPWHVPSGVASVFRAGLLDTVPFARRPRSHQTHRQMNHDHVVSLRAFAGGRRAELAEPLARYRQHGHNAAGDPSVTGLAALRRARSVGGDDYATLGEIAAEQGRFAAALPGSAPDTGGFFAALELRCARRANVYDPGGVAAGARRLGQAARAGVYRSRRRAGFGIPALGRDTAAVALGI